MLNWFRSKKALVKQIEELTLSNIAYQSENKGLRSVLEKSFKGEYAYQLMIKNTNAENEELKIRLRYLEERVKITMPVEEAKNG